MAVTEFLEAFDKKKKAEQAAAAAAPVSAKVAPAAPAMQTPVATPQQLDQMLADPATVNVGNAPAKNGLFPNIPLEQALIQTGRDIVEYGKSGDFATNAPGTTAPVDPIAQPDVLSAAPAVQAPAVQAETPFFQPTESGRRLSRGVGSAVDAVAGAGLAAMDAGGNFVNSSSDAVADLISQSTGGIVNLQSSPEFGQASTSTAGAPITDASQLRAFMSGLNEQAPVQAPAQASATATPVVEAETPVPVADLSVNGTDVVTPEAITEVGQVAPAAVEPQTPTAFSGGMITRDSTGESFIGGSQVAATPEEVAAYNATSRERMAAANTDAAAAERMRYNAPTIAEATGAGQTPTPRAPVRQSTKERDRSEKQRAQTLRKEGQRSIEDQMREFNREPHSMKERAAEKARLQGELNASIKEDRDYNRTTTEANFANETAAYNRNTLTAAQRATTDLASGKQTATELKANLIRQANPNLPEAEIAAIASGSVRVVQNPSTGETTLLNLATGASKKVNTGQETGLNFDVAAPENTLFSRAGEYTGAVEAAKRKGQGITGQFGVDIATDASIGAAQDFETAQNELVRAFRDSARYSATEANQLKKELNIALSPFEDPKTAEAKLRSIDKSLARRYKNEEAVALDENESIAKREDARSRARAISQFRATLGVPAEDAKPVENGNVPANIDAGDWEYMTEEQRKLFN